jgi:hypothetical protein
VPRLGSIFGKGDQWPAAGEAMREIAIVVIVTIEKSSPHFSPIDFFLGLRQFGGLLEMLEASNRVY